MNQNERREFLRNKDLEMSKQVDKIIKEAQPKPLKDIQPLLLKPVYPNIELTGTPEYIANKQMTDLRVAYDNKQGDVITKIKYIKEENAKEIGNLGKLNLVQRDSVWSSFEAP